MTKLPNSYGDGRSARHCSRGAPLSTGRRTPHLREWPASMAAGPRSAEDLAPWFQGGKEAEWSSEGGASAVAANMACRSRSEDDDDDIYDGKPTADTTARGVADNPGRSQAKGGTRPGRVSHPASPAPAKQDLGAMQRRQSKDLHAAVEEYRRRYGMPPPPNFDKWFQFAQDHDVQLVDEFDTIHDLMTPFWGLKPKTIRARAREALGYDNGLIGIAIRSHQVSHLEGGQEPINDFSKSSPELSTKMMFEQVPHSRFKSFSRQATWTHSRMSCPPDSPARVLDEDDRWDDRGQYAVSELGFVYNATAMADICLSPSLSSSYGFFDRPNTYRVVHDLFPIFSQSKISSYNDIFYPSPWYWSNQADYRPEQDVPWEEKESSLFWRGSTTGGFSRYGGPVGALCAVESAGRGVARDGALPP
ncbi:hypothetical protein E4U55_003193 [Claviceps digitariae]|nr:hypothetical protein E4U55_003193 [Claviceps digitariae]